MQASNTRGCIVVQDLPRHRHSDPRLSVSFQSQTRWMAGEWKSWLKPKPHTPASFHPRERQRERDGASRGGPPHHSVCDHPYTERPAAPALFRASISYHPLSRLLCFKIQIPPAKETALRPRRSLFSPFDLIVQRSWVFANNPLCGFTKSSRA